MVDKRLREKLKGRVIRQIKGGDFPGAQELYKAELQPLLSAEEAAAFEKRRLVPGAAAHVKRKLGR